MKTAKASRPRNPKWTEDELTLALDLFHQMRSSDISAKNPHVIELSQILNKLASVDKGNELFRNPNGVALKMHNFARFDSSRTARGMTHGGRLEETIWNRYADNRALLREAVSQIRSKVVGPVSA